MDCRTLETSVHGTVLFHHISYLNLIMLIKSSFLVPCRVVEFCGDLGWDQGTDCIPFLHGFYIS
jgi:hypothetical protein